MAAAEIDSNEDADANSGMNAAVGTERTALVLSGKVAIVTGGASEMGRACARELAEQGAKVVIADVNDTAGAEAVRAIAEAGGQLRYMHASSSERLDLHNLIATTLEAFGFVDILVCAASADEAVPFLDMSEEQFDRSIRAKLKGTFLSSQAVARQFINQIEEGRAPGVIITTGAAGVLTSEDVGSASAASSGGVAELTRSMATALAPHGIRVNALGPATASDLTTEVSNDADAEAEAPQTNVKELWADYLDKVASLTAWLVSDQASHISGETVYVGDRRMLTNGVK